MIRGNGFWRRAALPAVVGLLILVAGSGMTFADSVVVFNASGVVAGRPANGQATFSIVDNGGGTFTLTITLENTAGPGQLSGVASVLYGLGFSLSGVSSVSLTGGAAPGTVNCSTGTCVFDNTPVDPVALGWEWGTGWLGTGVLSSTNGSNPARPYGIANDNIEVADGIPNLQHNPYLLGPVTFTFLLEGGVEGVDPTISDVSFFFNTDGSSVSTPEPTTLLLLGAGLLGLGVLGKKIR